MAVTIDGSLGVSVPVGATGAFVPQAQEVSKHAFPSGTRVLFAQTAAPTGWTKDTTHNNKALRVVSGTAGSGGTVDFTTAFKSQAVSGTVGNTTLTEAQIPWHAHPVNNQNTTSYSVPGGSFYGLITGQTGAWTGGAGGGQGHNHTFTGTSINLAVQYVDAIIATKD